MALLEANGIEQYFESHGEGPPLVLVAGMGGTSNYWAEQVSHFKRTRQVLVYDQRGTGRSTHAPVESIDQLAEDLLALLDVLGLEKIDFVGHSTGGNIGQIIAIEQPRRIGKLVIYASTTHGDSYRAKVWRVRREILEKLGPELYGDMTSIMLYPPRWIVDNHETLESQQALQAGMLAPASIMTTRIEAIQAFDRRSDLSRISCETLVLCARDDIQTPLYFSEALAAGIPGARLSVIDQGGHACSRTVPGQFNELIGAFLDG
jgi:aminoacrylate hydrolase